MLAGYEAHLDEFKALGVSIIAGTVDSQEKTLEVASDLSFPIAWGMTAADADTIGAKWEPRRDHIQPTEFMLRGTRVMGSTYSNSPVGRMDPAETLTLLKMIDAAREAKERGKQNNKS